MALIVLGYDGKDLLRRAFKTLEAGAVGVGVGYVVTWLFVSTGLPYPVAAWPGYALGFIANFATQVKMRNIVVKRA